MVEVLEVLLRVEDVVLGEVTSTLWVGGRERASDTVEAPRGALDALTVTYREGAGDVPAGLPQALGSVLGAVRGELRAVLVDAARKGQSVVVDVDASGSDGSGWWGRYPWELLDLGDRPGDRCPVLGGPDDPGVVMRRVVNLGGADGDESPLDPVEGSVGSPLWTLVAAGPKTRRGRKQGLSVTSDSRKGSWVSGTGQVGFPVEWVEGVCSLDDLERRLPRAGGASRVLDVLVLVAHGRDGDLVLGGPDGSDPTPVTGAELAAVLRHRVRFVVLAACQGTAPPDGGSSIAVELAKVGIPVVALHATVLASVGRALSRELTAGLHAGLDAGAALAQARMALTAGTSPGMAGVASLWVPRSGDHDDMGDDVRLRPVEAPETGLRLGRVDPLFDRFVGRTREIAQICEWLHSDQAVLGVIGKPGAGKSKLLRHLIEEPAVLTLNDSSHQHADLDPPEEHRNQVIAALLRDPDGRVGAGRDAPPPDPLTENALIDRVGESLAYAQGGSSGLKSWRDRAITASGTPAQRWDSLVKRQPACPTGHRWVVVIDALDELDLTPSRRTGMREFLGHALANLPRGLRVIVSARTVDDLPDIDGHQVQRLVDLDAADGVVDTRSAIEKFASDVLNAAPELVTTPLSRASRQALAALIADQAQGVFLYARALLQDAVEFPLRADDPAEAGTLTFRLPDGLVGLYDQISKRVETRRWAQLRPVLGVLCACLDRTGFTAPQIELIMKSAGAGDVEVKGLLGEPAIAAFLQTDGMSRPRYRPFHASFADWILHDPDDAATGHRTIAEGLCKHLTGPAAADEKKPLASYHRSYTPRHLLAIIRTEDADLEDDAEWARNTWEEHLSGRPDVFELMIWERGAYTIATELRVASDHSVEAPQPWIHVCDRLVLDGYAAHATEVSHLVQTRQHALTNDAHDLAAHCDQRIGATFPDALILTSGAPHHDPRLRARLAWSGVSGLSWTQSGTHLAACGTQGVKVWEINDHGRARANPVARLDLDWPGAARASWNQNGTSLAVATHDSLTLWNVESHERSEFSVDADFVMDVEFSRAGNRVAVAADKGVRVWKTEPRAGGGADLQPMRLTGASSALRVTWSQDGGRLAAASHDGIWVWAADADYAIEWFCDPREQASGKRVFDLAWNHDGTRLAGCTDDGLLVWNPGDASCDEVDVTAIAGGAEEVAWSQEGTRLAASGVAGVWVWSVGRDGRLDSRSTPIHFGDAIEARSLAWSPDGSLLAATSSSGVWVWDVNLPMSMDQGSDIASLPVYEMLNCVAWNWDGTRLAGGGNGFVRVWDADGRGRVDPSSTPDAILGREVIGTCTELAWDPAGSRLAAIGETGVWIWAVALGACAKSTDAPLRLRKSQGFGPQRRLRLGELAWNRDGTYLAGVGDGGVYAWRADHVGDPSQSEPEHYLGSQSFVGWAHGVSWSASGNLVAALSLDQEVRVWSVDLTGLSDPGRPPDDILPGMFLGARVAWSEDGTRLAAAHSNGLSLWRVGSDGRLVSTVDPHYFPHVRSAYGVSWSRDGRQLVVAAVDGLWIIAPEKMDELIQVIPLPTLVRDIAWESTGLAVVTAAGRLIFASRFRDECADLAGSPATIAPTNWERITQRVARVCDQGRCIEQRVSRWLRGSGRRS